MKILFLGYTDSPLIDFLRQQGEEVVVTDEKIDPAYIKKIQPDFVVSYGYRHILKKDVLDLVPNRIINLHIAYLPWNKGAEPNVWCFLEGTPGGVTIHHIDEGIDTGDIIVQKLVKEEAHDTVKTYYDRLHSAMQELFRNSWRAIKSGRAPREKQKEKGTSHKVRDLEEYAFLLDDLGSKGHTPVSKLKNHRQKGQHS